ncbi:MAG: carbohydrate ABC transporter permease [Spirochaetaceae bacterium]|nr:carbohydrate ABC transporter permease [Spirochaetaceae bacterium]
MVTPRLRTAFSDRSLGSYSFDLINMALLLAVIFITLYPMYYIAIVSFSDGKEVLLGRVRFWPRGINLQSYQMVLRDDTVIRSLFNSILYTSVGTAINLVLSTLCAYPLSRRDFSGRKWLTLYVAITMFFQGGLIPLYLVVLQLGLLDTMWAIVLVPGINAFYMFIMRTYFQGQPTALHEAAIIDGANDIQILARIVVPLAKPIMATMLLFYAVQHWNSFFHALIFLTEKARYPLQLILRSVVVESTFEQMNDIGAATDFMVLEKTIRFSVIMVSTLPILLVYPFLQKYFVKGVMIGALKG